VGFLTNATQCGPCGPEGACGVLIRGELVRGAEGVAIRVELGLVAVGQLVVAGVVFSLVLAWPFVLACCDSLLMFPTLPRGIPKPADPSGMTTFFPVPGEENEPPRPTITGVDPGALGFRGGTNPDGGLLTRVPVLLNPAQLPPGCQPHPHVGTYTQFP